MLKKVQGRQMTRSLGGFLGVMIMTRSLGVSRGHDHDSFPWGFLRVMINVGSWQVVVTFLNLRFFVWLLACIDSRKNLISENEINKAQMFAKAVSHWCWQKAVCHWCWQNFAFIVERIFISSLPIKTWIVKIVKMYVENQTKKLFIHFVSISVM